MSEDLQDILGSLSDDQKKELIKALTAEVKPKKVEPKREARKPEETFTTNIKSSDEKGRVAGVPVSGTEHQDEKNTTPDVSHSERKRPAFKRVDQTCTRCNKSYEIHPQFARDFYICDSCLKK